MIIGAAKHLTRPNTTKFMTFTRGSKPEQQFSCMTLQALYTGRSAGQVRVNRLNPHNLFKYIRVEGNRPVLKIGTDTFYQPNPL